jgi:hypothetical protein
MNILRRKDKMEQEASREWTSIGLSVLFLEQCKKFTQVRDNQVGFVF